MLFEKRVVFVHLHNVSPPKFDEFDELFVAHHIGQGVDVAEPCEICPNGVDTAAVLVQLGERIKDIVSEKLRQGQELVFTDLALTRADKVLALRRPELISRGFVDFIIFFEEAVSGRQSVEWRLDLEDSRHISSNALKKHVPSLQFI